ncbi:MAG TPA: PilZ domain-containing protein [Pyrinomonadaceae bacterium]|nr:PilZ domain-containing protein [Pyrinomonadaceae bacterium]
MNASQPPSPPDDHQSGGSERRGATRYAAQLDARLLFQLSVEPAPGGENGDDPAGTAPQTLKLVGHTRNISEAGLAFVVPTLRIGDRFARVLGRQLRITLYLPSGQVEILATPVRYEQLPPGDPERGYIIGVRIVKMADDEWVRMVSYVRTLR